MTWPSNACGLASHLVGREVLREAAELLTRRGIPVMPLKGIWLQHVVYQDPGERPITDVDILVPDKNYADAIAVLERGGWRVLAANISETALCLDRWPLPIDLHRRLFTRFAFRMPSSDLFGRGVRNADALGIDVVLPDPLDVFAHLVGHFVKSRGGPLDGRAQLRDLVEIARCFRLDPVITARHLEACGLRRVARFALPGAAPNDDRTGFLAAVLASLSHDPIGGFLARAMLELRARVSVSSPWAAAPGFALESSIPHAFCSLLVRLWDRQYDVQIRDGRQAPTGAWWSAAALP